jgi:hypothetical protein
MTRRPAWCVLQNAATRVAILTVARQSSRRSIRLFSQIEGLVRIVQPTAIIVSPYFPPSTLAGVHRARHLAKHLPAAGWNPIVLCVDEAFHEQALDPGLADLVPCTAEIVKVPALPASITRRFGVGDVGLRAWSGMRRALHALVRSRSPRTVLISGAPFYPLLMAPGLRRTFGIPVVLDFQDPWVSKWGGRQPRLSKVGLAHDLACRLEPRALRGASFVTSVSATQNDEMAARYPWLDRVRMAAIPIGGDPEDFAQLRRADIALPDGALDPERVNLSFVGTFMPRSDPLVRLVLQALGRLRQREPSIGGRLRLSFVGTSNQPDDHTTLRVVPIAREMGVGVAVHEIPQRVPFLQALAILARADTTLLIGSDEAHYTASKIYPALMSGRPFLSLFHHASSAHAILSAAGGGRAHAYHPGTGHEALIDDLVQSLRRIVTEPTSLGRVDPAAFAPFEAKAVAACFAAIFDEVSTHA